MRPKTAFLAALLPTAACLTPPAGPGLPEAPDPPPPAPEAPERAPTATPAPPPTPTAAPIWRRPVVDLHVDTLSRVRLEGLDLDDDPALQSSLQRLEEGGVGIIVEAVWVPAANRAPDPHGWALATLALLQEELQARPDTLYLVTHPEELALPDPRDRLGIVLALEGGHALRDVADVARFADLGVRMIGLTWSFSNALCGSSGDAPPPGTGLTPLGAEVVREMNRLGLAIDVSHASDACLEDVLALSTAPVLASHSNTRALRDVPRNLSDAQLHRLADAGGLVGVMFHAPFVAEPARREDVVAHLTHLAGALGWDHVALGSDFDGWIQLPEGLRSAADLPALAEALRATPGIPAEAVPAVMGANARAWLRQTWALAEAPPPAPIR